MLFIDYLTMLLVNMTAGLLILACWFLWGISRPDQRFWAAGFAIVAMVALAGGVHMVWTWPLPDLGADGPNLMWANIAYGETSVMLGALFAGAALAVGFRWRLHAVGVYALVAGAAAILTGLRIGQLGLSAAPTLTMIGFVLTGLGGVLALPAIAAARNKPLRGLVALVLVVAAAIWAMTAGGAIWSHLGKYSG